MIEFIVKKIFPLLILMLIGLSAPAIALELLGNWTYRQTGSDAKDSKTQSEFQQRYQLGVGPSLTFQPTPAITVSGGVGYRNTQRDTGNGRESVEQVSPFAQFTLANDIFVAQLAANSYTTMAGSDNSTSFWNANLNSAWDEPYWPSISLSYGEDYSGVNKSTLFDDSNGKNKNTTVNIDWDLSLASLYYQYTHNEFVNNVGDIQNESDSHYVRLDTSGRFWDDRILFNLGQEYRESTAKFFVEDSGNDSENNFSYVRVGGQTLSLVVNAVTGPDPEDVVLQDNPMLNDDIYDLPAVIVDPIDKGYFGFSTGSVIQVDSLYLYMDPLTQLTPGQASGLQWTLYTRNSVTLLWDQVIESVPFIYNDDEKRFELDVNIGEPEIMVAMANPSSGIPLVFTELVAFRQITEDTTSKTTNYRTNTSLNYRITQSLMTSLSLTYEHNDTQGNDIYISERDKIVWSGRLQWSPNPYVTPSLGYSEYREKFTGKPDDLNRLYSIIVSTRPLPTTNVSLAYTHNDRYSDNDKTYSADTFSLYSKFAIYPDLSASMSNSYTISDILTFNGEPDDQGDFVNTKSFTNRLDISAKLYRYVTSNATVNYNTTNNEISGNTDSANITVDLNYRPSDILSLQAGYSAFFLDDARTNGWFASMEYWLLRTSKTRLSFYARHLQAKETQDAFRMIGSWNISDIFTFTTSGNYSFGPVDVYTFNASLSMRL